MLMAPQGFKQSPPGHLLRNWYMLYLILALVIYTVVMYILFNVDLRLVVHIYNVLYAAYIQF